jgi:hypothetical protein
MELIGHRSISTMRMLRLPSPFSSPSVPLGSDTNYDIAFSSRLDRVAISTLPARIVWVRSISKKPISLGGVRLSCVPVLPLSASDMFLDPGRISPARHKRWFDVAPIMLTFKASALNSLSRLNSIPSTVAVYASCQHLC